MKPFHSHAKSHISSVQNQHNIIINKPLKPFFFWKKKHSTENISDFYFFSPKKTGYKNFSHMTSPKAPTHIYDKCIKFNVCLLVSLKYFCIKMFWIKIPKVSHVCRHIFRAGCLLIKIWVFCFCGCFVLLYFFAIE